MASSPWFLGRIACTQSIYIWPIATDVVRSVVWMSVRVLGITVSCAKTGEPIEMPLLGLTHVSPGTMY